MSLPSRRTVVFTGALLAMPLPSNAAEPNRHWSLAIHGGAGVISRESLTPEMEAAYRAGLDEALKAGEKVLTEGGTALNAVTAAVKVLEDNPLFNAGRGAVFTAEGRIELDAAIMDGATLKAGSVAGLTATRNPIDAARAVMENSPHVLLVSDGADRFSLEQGLPQVTQDYFHTDKRWQQLQRWKEGQKWSEIDPDHRYGTVGAVALDSHGNLAAATSTGGTTGKRWGRVGDSPIIGAGTYARNGVCAVSATGTGEYFIRESAARQICDRRMWNNEDIQSAANNTIASIGAIGGDGGLIAMDGEGRVAFALNVQGMYRGQVASGTTRRTAIFAEE